MYLTVLVPGSLCIVSVPGYGVPGTRCIYITGSTRISLLHIYGAYHLTVRESSGLLYHATYCVRVVLLVVLP